MATTPSTTDRIAELERLVTELTTKVDSLINVRNTAQREMTDEDARRILNGDLASKKHKDAATELGLSYGQIYSCRLQFTFKHIHKELSEKQFKNPWVK